MAQVKALIGNIKGKDGMANVYSTSETVIGTWNGSTLYRKIFKTTVPTSNGSTTNSVTITCGISYNKVISVYVLNAKPSTTAFSSLGLNGQSDIFVYSSGNNIILSNANSFYGGAECYVVIEYIK